MFEYHLCISMQAYFLTENLSIDLHIKLVLIGNVQCKRRSKKTGPRQNSMFSRLRCSQTLNKTTQDNILAWSPHDIYHALLDYRHTQLAMFPMHAHEVRLMHNNGIKAEIQLNKYIYHMVGINVPINQSFT